MTNEQALQKFILEYDIDVPEDRVENEYQCFLQQAKHNLQYDSMTTGRTHIAALELPQMEDELRERAFLEAKTDLVMKEILAQQNFSVSPEELQAKAEQLVENEQTTMDMVKRFYGEDLSGLERAVKEEKAKEWMISQIG